MIGDLEFLGSLVQRRSGIVIGRDKGYLVETRLAPLMRRRGLKSLQELATVLRLGDRLLEKEVIEAMATNETLFFRDKVPFELFQNVILPHLMGARPPGSKVRIWCAACSSGQEPYSLAMMLDELGVAGRGWNFEILATDISEAMIVRAKDGLYSQFEVQRGLPIRNLIRNFAQEGTNWRIEQRLRDRVEFRVLNLLDDFDRLGPFDVVLCRNVLIYFDEATKGQLLDRIARVMVPDGLMMLGAAESPYGLTTRLTRHVEEGGLVVRADGPLAAAHPVPVVRRAG